MNASSSCCCCCSRPPVAVLVAALAVSAASCSRADAPKAGRDVASITPGTSADAAAPSPGPSALSFVIVHASVFGGAPGADAVAVADTRIAAVGTSAELLSKCTSPCKVVDAQGGFVMPGFHDAHAHPFAAGKAAAEFEVRSASIPKIQAAVKAYAAAHPDEDWLLGRGWLSARFTSWPTAADLDVAEAKRPVVLTDSSGHNLWVNSAALEAAGITASTPDPPGGKIVHPLGVFLDMAQQLVTSKEPAISDETVAHDIQTGLAPLLAVGVTSVAESGTEPLRIARAYAALDKAQRLRQRVFLWGALGASDADFQKWLDFGKSLPADGKVQLVAFKGFTDGTMAARTAALLKPYADDPSTQGELVYSDQSVLDARVLRANKAGYPVALHAIGDRAVRQALDAFEHSATSLHHTLVNRVEHANVVDRTDMPRFGALHVAASVQPVWQHLYPSLSSFLYLDRLGPARADTIYAWRSLADAGALLVFGSDYPSSTDFDPIAGIYAATTRSFENGEVFAPTEVIDPDAALRAYTRAAPSIMGWGDRLGSIAPGQLADVLLLARDPRLGATSTVDDPIRRLWIGGAEVSLGAGP